MLLPRCAPLVLVALVTACDARPTVVINEFMPDNDETVADGATGEYFDWIELYNIGEETLSLDGLFLTDDLERPTQHPLSSSLSIGPGGFLLLWASKNAVNDPTHLNFALSNDGEELGLFWMDPASGNLIMLDGLVFHSLATDDDEADLSLAREEDGTGAWQNCDQPTPGASNR